MTRSKNFPSNDRLDQKIIGLTKEEELAINYSDSLFVYKLIGKGTTLVDVTGSKTYNGGFEIAVQFTTTKKLNHAPLELRKMITSDSFLAFPVEVIGSATSGESFGFFTIGVYDLSGTMCIEDVVTHHVFTMPVNSYDISYREVTHE